MSLILALGPARFLQVSRGRGVHVVHEFIKRATITAVESKFYLCANMFGVINGLGALQDERLKNNHPLGVPFPILHTIKLH